MPLTATDILQQGRKIIEAEITKEMALQGHYLTGNAQRSQTAQITQGPIETILEGEIAYYANIVNYGFDKSKASMRQFPFLVKYFQLRGFDEKNAKNFAAATIKKWMKESGMPTAASARFSKSGNRLNQLTIAIGKASPKVDAKITKSIDEQISSNFTRSKNETV